MDLIESCLIKNTLTENGALTNSTSLNPILDLFFIAGACRKEKQNKIEGLIAKSFESNKLLTLKLIFWAGDIRNGAGERRFFKIALNWLNQNYPDILNKNLKHIPHFSRWDVLFEIDNKNILPMITKALIKEKNGLVAKWLPRKKQYNNFANKIRKYLDITPKQYRALLVEASNVVETKICSKKWNEIEYKKVPSIAMNKYINCFYKNDNDRFKKYIEDIKDGKTSINSGVIFPHTIIQKALNQFGEVKKDKLTEADIVQWNNLPNYLQNMASKMLPVCDVSGSMYGLPIAISIALGIYISERNNGIFKDAFITFSESPQMQFLKGNLNDRISQLFESDWGMSTNLQSVFNLILNKAIENKINDSQMPDKILIISDMEFNTACDNTFTNFEEIENKYRQNNYKMPSIVFWNVNGRVGNCPITVENKNVALVSGATPSIITTVLSSDIDPINIMLKTINNERYDILEL